ncbi:MAG TPA: Rrf2 family transcriptional regulator [Phycisphaerae bacterium]|nr:Rrf2 family transcriptional regulator [Phycisphaerae bacterium]
MTRSKSTIYALLAVLEAAQRRKAGDESPLKAAEFARQYRLPRAYAGKMISQLVQAKILASHRGPKGGFLLGRQPRQITLGQVVDAVKGLEEDYTKAMPAGTPRAFGRGILAALGDATQRAQKSFGAVTVDGFLKRCGRR